ncbi:hypothetical protein [Salinicola socius]|uniref:Uncharacterized protein n=1 Tax=Salinicola socius TaxID=404433 RepID=A0A1Q8SUL8_9GAMM|nr:hypothetical protein [Salinicola socius]OLO05145.1 hypothetical protein BTW07_05910 [Salinicola socius]
MTSPQRPKPGADEPTRTVLRLIGSFAAPVVVYLVGWELVAQLILPGVAAGGREFVINLFSVLIPFVGVLLSVYLAGIKAGRLMGGGVMAIFFLYLYTSSGVVFSWLPVALTLGGIALAVLAARYCPTLKPDLGGAFG